VLVSEFMRQAAEKLKHNDTGKIQIRDIFRQGGDEFAAILAPEIANNFMTALESNLARTVKNYEKYSGLGISLGVGHTKEEADENMYATKQAKPNRGRKRRL